jgi:hypothetical protein
VPPHRAASRSRPALPGIVWIVPRSWTAPDVTASRDAAPSTVTVSFVPPDPLTCSMMGVMPAVNPATLNCTGKSSLGGIRFSAMTLGVRAPRIRVSIVTIGGAVAAGGPASAEGTAGGQPPAGPASGGRAATLASGPCVRLAIILLIKDEGVIRDITLRLEVECTQPRG